MKELLLDKKEVGEWVKKKIPHIESWGNEYTAIGWARSGSLFCGVIYNHYSGNDIAMHVAGIGYWATPAILRAFFRYPFVQLKCQRVTAYVGSKNSKCISLVNRLGFISEGRMRRGLAADDLMIFGMLRSECRWLDE